MLAVPLYLRSSRHSTNSIIIIIIIIINVTHNRGLRLKPNKALDKIAVLELWASPAMWDHTVLPASECAPLGPH